MMKLSLLFCALAMFALGAVNCTSPQQAPAPSGDCSTLIFNLVDCLSFVTNGSKVSKPQGGCCNGLKTVLKADVQCVCQAFKNSAQLGVVLNVTKTLTLPAACGVSDSDISSCGLSGGAPDAAPAPPPKSSSPTPSSPKSPAPSPPVAHAPSPATYPGGGNTDEAPAPAPNSASSFSISLTALLVSVLVALCSYF